MCSKFVFFFSTSTSTWLDFDFDLWLYDFFFLFPPQKWWNYQFKVWFQIAIGLDNLKFYQNDEVIQNWIIPQIIPWLINRFTETVISGGWSVCTGKVVCFSTWTLGSSAISFRLGLVQKRLQWWRERQPLYLLHLSLWKHPNKGLISVSRYGDGPLCQLFLGPCVPEIKLKRQPLSTKSWTRRHLVVWSDPVVVTPPYASDHMFARFHGIQVQGPFFLRCFHDMGITVDPTGQVGKMVGPFCGTGVLLIGWTFAVTVTILGMILTIRPIFWRLTWHFSSAWRDLIWLPRGIPMLLICTRQCASQVHHWTSKVFHYSVFHVHYLSN